MTGWETRPTGRQVAVRAFQSSWAVIGAMPSLVLGTMLIYIALNIGATELSKLLPADSADLEMWPDSPWAYPPLYQDFLPLQASQILRYFLEAWITAPLEIAIYRFVLLNEYRPVLSPFSVMARRYAMWTFAVSILMMVIDQFEFLPEPWNGLHVPAILICLFAFAWLPLLFCTLAIDEMPFPWKERIRMAVWQIRGNVWLLVRTMLLVLGPLVLLAMAYSLFKDWTETLPDQATRLLDWRYRFVEAFLIVSYYFPVSAATAWIYAWAVKPVDRFPIQAFD